MTTWAEQQGDSSNDINMSISLTRIDSYQSNAPALLLIHGWGAGSYIWRGCIELLRADFDIYLLDLPGHGLNCDLSFVCIEDFINQFAKQFLILSSCDLALPKHFSIIAWSLGGLFASLLAQKFSNRVSALVTIATNQCFVSHDTWLPAMPASLFKAFSQALTNDSDASEKVLSRFYALQTQGVPSARNDVKNIKTLLGDTSHCVSGLQQGLAWLSDYDLSSCWEGLSTPTLRQFGAHDNLVPRAAADLIATRYPHHSVEVFEQSAHLPFITERDSWLLSTVDFIKTHHSSVNIDKREIAQSFSNAVAHYDSLAVFQHAVGDKLMACLPEGNVNRVLDLGAGTGYFSAALRQRYPTADIVEVDISSAMLASCQSRAVNNFQVQADIESLSFRPQSFDSIYSNLSIQWCHNLDKVFQNVADSLVEGGTAVLSTLVDGSLFELKKAWASVDDEVHVNVFENELSLKTSCEKSGLRLQHWLVEDDVQTFSTMRDLVRSVKDIGAHNMHPDRPKGLMGKNKYHQFIETYNTLRTKDNKLPLTYRVLYMVLKK